MSPGSFAFLWTLGLIIDLIIITIGLLPPHIYFNGFLLGAGISLLTYDLYKLKKIFKGE